MKAFVEACHLRSVTTTGGIPRWNSDMTRLKKQYRSSWDRRLSTLYSDCKNVQPRKNTHFNQVGSFDTYLVTH